MWLLPEAGKLGPDRGRRVRVAAVVAGLAVLTGYLLPGLAHPAAEWPLWDVSVYWWGGQQAVHDAALYAASQPVSFTYPPFAAALFGIDADAPVSYLQAAVTIGSICALPVLCWLALGAARLPRRPEIVFAVTALALLTEPVRYTLHLGEVNLILAALVGADLLRRHDGGWWQGIATGLAAGIKLTPLIFVAYLLITRRVRAAATAAGTFAATIAAGFVLLPSQSRAFWLGGVFLNERRIANPANPSDQSLSGVLARLGGGLGAARPWLLAAELLTAVAGLAIMRLGSPARSPARRGGVLRHHRPAGLADLLDPPLGLGRAAADNADRDGVAAALTLVRPGRRGGRRHLLRRHPDSLALASARSAAAARG